MRSTEIAGAIGQGPGIGAPCLLVAAHPGHELRLHAWLVRATPRVVILTDGSGGVGHPRLASSAGILAAAGSTRASIFGRFSDREAYALLLDGNVPTVLGLADEIRAEIAERGIRDVVSDAAEGFNPVHDLATALAAAAVERVRRRGPGAPLRHFEFLLEAAPDAGRDEGAFVLELDDEQFERKIAAARAYEELRFEVDRAFELHGARAFRREIVRPVASDPFREFREGREPMYERIGRSRVADGRYERCLRFGEHFLPALDALRDWSHGTDP